MTYSQQDFTEVATIPRAIAEWAIAVGGGDPDQEWLLSNYDTWVRNPLYRGAPGPHPDDDGWTEQAHHTRG